VSILCLEQACLCDLQVALIVVYFNPGQQLTLFNMLSLVQIYVIHLAGHHKTQWYSLIGLKKPAEKNYFIFRYAGNRLCDNFCLFRNFLFMGSGWMTGTQTNRGEYHRA